MAGVCTSGQEESSFIRQSGGITASHPHTFWRPKGQVENGVGSAVGVEAALGPQREVTFIELSEPRLVPSWTLYDVVHQQDASSSVHVKVEQTEAHRLLSSLPSSVGKQEPSGHLILVPLTQCHKRCSL